VFLAGAYGLQTAGLELTTVASTGFITGLYVVFTPLLALVVFGTPVPRSLWAGVALAVVGLLLLNGVPGGSALGNALVLGNAVFQAFQITAMERFAPRYDPRALTFLQMATSFVGFTVIALALGEFEVPRGATCGARSSSRTLRGALGHPATVRRARLQHEPRSFTSRGPLRRSSAYCWPTRFSGGSLARLRRDDGRSSRRARRCARFATADRAVEPTLSSSPRRRQRFGGIPSRCALRCAVRQRRWGVDGRHRRCRGGRRSDRLFD
jgi:hypothetical protein